MKINVIRTFLARGGRKERFGVVNGHNVRQRPELVLLKRRVELDLGELQQNKSQMLSVSIVNPLDNSVQVEHALDLLPARVKERPPLLKLAAAFAKRRH